MHRIRVGRRARGKSGRWSIPNAGQTLVAMLSVGALAGAAPSAAQADLAAGSYVLNGSVLDIVHGAAGTFVAGTFTGQFRPTGGGLIVPDSGSGEPDPSAFPHFAGRVYTAVGDGAGGWFVGGIFTVEGHPEVRDLAHIQSDGTIDADWIAPPRNVRALVRSGDKLYVGQGCGVIAVEAATGARADWSLQGQAGAICSNGVADLAVSGSTLFVGGDFSWSLNEGQRRYLAAVDLATGHATSWTPEPDNPVSSLATSGSTLYVGGRFSAISAQGRSRLAAFNASSGSLLAWNPAVVGFDVADLGVSGSTVFAGGNFTKIGGADHDNLAALDASTGSATAFNASLGPSETVNSVAVGAGTVFVGGRGGSNASRAYNASTGAQASWNPNAQGDVHAVSAQAGKVFVGGRFAGAGAPLASVGGLAKLTGDGDLDTSWAPSPGPGGVNSMALSGTKLYVGGTFSSIGGTSRDRLAALSTSTGTASAWNPGFVGELNPSVHALAIGGSTLYVGGRFGMIAGATRSSLAAFDTGTDALTAWNPGAMTGPLGSAIVYAIEPLGSTVYVGGLFTSIAGAARSNAAALDTTSASVTAWAPNATESPFIANVTAIHPEGARVYIGGEFAKLAGVPRNVLGAVDATAGGVLPFDAAANTSLGTVAAFARSGSSLIVGGSRLLGFDNLPRPALGSVDAETGVPTTWRPRLDADSEELAGRGETVVSALALAGAKLFTGGTFLAANGEVTGPLAALDPTPPPDTTPPSITVWVKDGQHFEKGSSLWLGDTRCEDDDSGIASCVHPEEIDTSSLALGEHEFTVTATNRAGLKTTKTIAYVVDPPSEDPPSEDPPAGDPPTPAPPIDPVLPIPSGPAAPTGPSPSLGGGGQASPSTFGTEVRDALAALRSPSGKAAKIPALLKSGYRFTFKAPSAGKLQMTWYFLPKGARLAKAKPVALARVTRTVTRPGSTRVTIKLSAAGKKKLKRSRSVKITAKATFTPSGQRPVSATRAFVARR